MKIKSLTVNYSLVAAAFLASSSMVCASNFAEEMTREALKEVESVQQRVSGYRAALAPAQATLQGLQTTFDETYQVSKLTGLYSGDQSQAGNFVTDSKNLYGAKVDVVTLEARLENAANDLTKAQNQVRFFGSTYPAQLERLAEMQWPQPVGPNGMPMPFGQGRFSTFAITQNEDGSTRVTLDPVEIRHQWAARNPWNAANAHMVAIEPYELALAAQVSTIFGPNLVEESRSLEEWFSTFKFMRKSGIENLQILEQEKAKLNQSLEIALQALTKKSATPTTVLSNIGEAFNDLGVLFASGKASIIALQPVDMVEATTQVKAIFVEKLSVVKESIRSARKLADWLEELYNKLRRSGYVS